MLQFSVWKDQIILHMGEVTSEDVADAQWAFLSTYARFVEKVGGYMISFSKQNLIRLSNLFPGIKPRNNSVAIELLKGADTRLKREAAMAVGIKQDKNLPSIEYKVAPLGDYQHRGVQLLSNTRVVPLFADCGMGKSFQVLVSTEQQIKNGTLPRGKTLICAKLATLHCAWLEDAAKFTDLKVVCLWFKQSAKKKSKVLAALKSDADVFLINHDGVRVYRKELAEMQFEKVVVDESTILKSFKGESTRIKGGQFGKALMDVAQFAQWRVIMSGTPAPNGVQDLWGQFKFLDPNGLLLEASYRDFQHSYMEEIVFGNPNNPNNPRTWVPRKGSALLVHSVIEPLTYRLKIRDYLTELPNKTVVPRRLDAGPQQRGHYEDMLEFLSTTIDDSDVTVRIKLAQISKLRQITGGFLINAEEEVIPMDVEENPKVKALDCLLEDEIDVNQKVVIFAQHKYEISLIENRYKHFGIVSVYGENSSSTNIDNIKRFITDPATRLIVLHPKSAAHGITLTCAHYMVFYSVSYSAEEDYQCVARIERASQKNAMFVYYLLLRDTIDEIIYAVVQNKIHQQGVLLDEDSATENIWADLVQKLKSKSKSRRGRHASRRESEDLSGQILR